MALRSTARIDWNIARGTESAQNFLLQVTRNRTVLSRDTCNWLTSPSLSQLKRVKIASGVWQRRSTRTIARFIEQRERLQKSCFFGRKLRRCLPVLGKTSKKIDETELREKDAREKLIAQERENLKRGARPPTVKVGDEVVLKRIQKSKDQTVFSPVPFTVKERNQGDFQLQGTDGQILK